MTSVAQGESIGVSNPKLVFTHQLDGKLVDPDSLSFRILSKTTDAEKVQPVEVVASTVVDLTNDKLSTGRHAATWAVGAAQKVGLYEIEWTYVSENGGDSKMARLELEVLAGTGALLGPSYALVSDLREEGISANVSDARIQLAIVVASRFIEEVTGRFFEPRYQIIRFDGRGKRAVLLGDPIVGIEKIRLETEPSLQPDLEVDADLYRVFSRHLSQGLLNPDDRDSPKIEFVHVEDLMGVGNTRFVPLSGISLRSLGFPWGVQNVEVTGVFGYTENVHNGSPWGDVPTLIRHVTKLLARRNIPTITNECRTNNERWRIVETKVRDQSIKLAQPRKFGEFTGDAEIDQLLVMFMRPPALGAA